MYKCMYKCIHLYKIHIMYCKNIQLFSSFSGRTGRHCFPMARSPSLSRPRCQWRRICKTSELIKQPCGSVDGRIVVNCTIMRGTGCLCVLGNVCVCVKILDTLKEAAEMELNKKVAKQARQAKKAAKAPKSSVRKATAEAEKTDDQQAHTLPEAAGNAMNQQCNTLAETADNTKNQQANTLAPEAAGNTENQQANTLGPEAAGNTENQQASTLTEAAGNTKNQQASTLAEAANNTKNQASTLAEAANNTKNQQVSSVADPGADSPSQQQGTAAALQQKKAQTDERVKQALEVVLQHPEMGSCRPVMCGKPDFDWGNFKQRSLLCKRLHFPPTCVCSGLLNTLLAFSVY